MKKLFLILFLACLPAAAAVPTLNLTEDPTDIIDLTKGPYVTGDVTITLVDEAANDTVSMLSPKATYTIVQGQTRSHTIYRSASHIVELNWGNPSNSLKLTIRAPSGQTIGTLSDNSDGISDGRIRVAVNANSGMWKYQVTGDIVTGTQTYTIA